MPRGLKLELCISKDSFQYECRSYEGSIRLKTESKWKYTAGLPLGYFLVVNWNSTCICSLIIVGDMPEISYD